MRRGQAVLFALVAAVAPLTHAADTERWTGVDETVIEKVATEAGQQPWRSLLDGTGDLPLFFFLCAGIVGGFVLGYSYRAVFTERRHIDKLREAP